MTSHTALQIVTTIAELRALLTADRRSGRRVGFVPTMGYLHPGHQSLIQTAAAENDRVAVSIFVNPLQFAPTEDLDDYPRDLPRDVALCAESGADLVFAPSVDEMYPSGAVLTEVSVRALGSVLEGQSRPAHFAGVATVVAKLFGIVGRCRAYFGEKDYQQLVLVRRMSADLSMPVEVIGCPTVREPDGLAMSSRNSYLDAQQRAAAPVLYRALRTGIETLRDGERRPAAIVDKMKDEVRQAPLVDLDYAAVADPVSLQVPAVADLSSRLLIAARIGRTRLIDNTGVLPAQDTSK